MIWSAMRRSPAIDGVKQGGVEQPILAYQFSRNQNMRKACRLNPPRWGCQISCFIFWLIRVQVRKQFLVLPPFCNLIPSYVIVFVGDSILMREKRHAWFPDLCWSQRWAHVCVVLAIKAGRRSSQSHGDGLMLIAYHVSICMDVQPFFIQEVSKINEIFFQFGDLCSIVLLHPTISLRSALLY
jgi:hypothetical protein